MTDQSPVEDTPPEARTNGGAGSAAQPSERPKIVSFPDVQEQGRHAVEAVRDVTDNFTDAVDKSLKARPYTTLALVAALGFVLAAMRRR